MTAADVVSQALADEQERLAQLPHGAPSSESLADFYGGRLVLERCHYSGQKPYQATPQSPFVCQLCYLDANEKTVVGGVMAEHARALRDDEQVERTIGIVAAVLGFDEWGDAGVYARAATRDEGARRLGDDGKISRGVAHLAEQLARRDATQGAQKAIADLLSFARERDEHPLFTEAGLYDLIGKDDARSVLSRLRTLTTAMGAD